MDGFRNRVPTNVVEKAQRDPAAFRSGFAEGLEELGGAIMGAAKDDAQVREEVAASQHRVALEEQRRRRSAQVAEGASRWAEVQAGVAADLDGLRKSSAPGAVGYQEQADAAITARLTAFHQSLPDDAEVRQRFEPLIAQFGATTRLGEQRWAILSKAKFEGQNIDTWSVATGNAIISDPQPAKLQAAFTATDMLIDALDVPGTEKAALKAGKKSGFARNFLDGRLAQGDGAGVRALLDSGQFDTLIDPAVKVNYRQRAENAVAASAREVELAQARQQEEARDGIRTIEAKIGAGITPDAAEVRAVQAAAKAAGLDAAELVKLDALDVKIGVNRSYGPLIGTEGGAERIRRDRNALDEKIASGKATEHDQIMRAQLDALVEQADKKEADALRDLAGKGPQGKLAALDMLTGSAEGRYDKAEKIAPGLGPIALLRPIARKLAVEGGEIRAGRGDDFGKEADVRRMLNEMLGPVANEVGNFKPIMTTAWDIMVSRRVTHGGAGLDRDDLWQGVKLATGGSIRPDGKVQGGLGKVRGKPVIMPDWMTEPEFDRAISRLDFSNAVYANNAPVEKDDVLARYRPSYFGEDAQGRVLYHFIDPAGGVLADKGGSAVVLKVSH